MQIDDVKISGRDLRVGMGIGGYDMEWAAEHMPSGCKVIWQSHGAYPESQHKLRDRALMALELMVEIYDAD